MSNHCVTEITLGDNDKYKLLVMNILNCKSDEGKLQSVENARVVSASRHIFPSFIDRFEHTHLNLLKMSLFID